MPWLIHRSPLFSLSDLQIYLRGWRGSCSSMHCWYAYNFIIVFVMLLIAKLQYRRYLMGIAASLFVRILDAGNYCPTGSAAVVQCIAGTWGSAMGLQTAACSGQCTAGMGTCFPKYTFCCFYVRHCLLIYVPNIHPLTQLVLPGYYCPAGSISATANICPVGYVHKYMYTAVCRTNT